MPPSPSPPSLQVECKAIMVFFHYCVVSNYFWLFIEGLYLFTLLVETFFPERRYFYWYTIIGWGRSLTVASAQATWLRSHGQVCPWSCCQGMLGQGREVLPCPQLMASLVLGPFLALPAH